MKIFLFSFGIVELETK